MKIILGIIIGIAVSVLAAPFVFIFWWLLESGELDDLPPFSWLNERAATKQAAAEKRQFEAEFGSITQMQRRIKDRWQ